MRDLSYQKTKYDKEGLIKHLNEFKLEPKFSLGVWYFAPGGGRFHDRYVPAMTIEERLNLAAEMKDLGFTGLEAHYPAEINNDNIDLYKNLQQETGLQVVGIPFSHFFETDFINRFHKFISIFVVKFLQYYFYFYLFFYASVKILNYSCVKRRG